MLLFIGTQANEAGQGIVAARLDERTGALTSLGVAAEAARPTWVLADPALPVLYAVSEVGEADDGRGEVLSYAVDAGRGGLAPLSRAGAGGGGPTHLALDARGRTLFAANFKGGQVSALPVDEVGRLAPPRSVMRHEGSGPHRRQAGPHPHGVTLDPSGRFLLAPDMGADRTYVYHVGPDHALSPAATPYVATPPGSGPRLVLFGADGRFAYLLSELSAELFVYAWDGRAGELDLVQQLALDEADAEGARSAAALAISADGRFLYASNRRTDAIHAYAVDRESGRFALVQVAPSGGAKPWSATIAPGGGWLVVTNQGSDDVRAFAIDAATGALTPGEGALAVGVPTSVAFPPA